MSNHKADPAARLREFKLRARIAARELGYIYTNPLIVDQINAAKSEEEITQIMRTERERQG